MKSPKDVVVIPVGLSGQGFVAHLASQEYGYTILLPPTIAGNTHERVEADAESRIPEYQAFAHAVAQQQPARITVVVGGELESGALLVLLEALHVLRIELEVVLYLRGANTDLTGGLIEKVLLGVLTNKARAGFFRILIVREQELSQVFGELWMRPHQEERYYREVADQWHILNIFEKSQPSVVRTNLDSDMAVKAKRREFARIGTFMIFQLVEGKIARAPFFSLDKEEFVTYLLDTGTGEPMVPVVQAFDIEMSDPANKNVLVQCMFYSLPEKIALRCGTIFTTSTAD